MNRIVNLLVFLAIILFLLSCDQPGEDKPKSIEDELKEDIGIKDTTSNTEIATDSTK